LVGICFGPQVIFFRYRSSRHSRSQGSTHEIGFFYISTTLVFSAICRHILQSFCCVPTIHLPSPNFSLYLLLLTVTGFKSPFNLDCAQSQTQVFTRFKTLFLVVVTITRGHTGLRLDFNLFSRNLETGHAFRLGVKSICHGRNLIVMNVPSETQPQSQVRVSARVRCSLRQYRLRTRYEV